MTSGDAITALVYAYAERIDAGDFAGVGVLFEHATYRSHGGGEYRGAAAVQAIMERLVMRYDDGTPKTKHLTTNLAIEVDEHDVRATARSYFTVIQAVAGAPMQPIVSGRYHDAFIRDAGVWRFDDRLIFMDLLGDLSRHLRRA